MNVKQQLPGLQNIQPPLIRTPIASQLLPPLPLNELLIQDHSLLFPQQAQGLLVLFCQVLPKYSHTLRNRCI